MNTKQFQPGQIITLYDASSDRLIFGELIFRPLNIDNSSKTLDDVFVLPKKEQEIQRVGKIPPQTFLSKYDIPNPAKIFKLRILALALLFFSVLGFTSIVLPVAAAEISLRLNQAGFASTEAKKEILPNDSYKSSFQYLSEQARDRHDLPLTAPREFKIQIPKINVDSKIIPNVDPANEEMYKKDLMQGVAHAKGSYFPGQNGPIFLFSHSTDGPWNVKQWNAQFYALKDLEIGDEVKIVYNGKTYQYKVSQKKVISPWDLQVVRAADTDLIMSTCWPPGTDWQRLVVFAEETS